MADYFRKYCVTTYSPSSNGSYNCSAERFKCHYARCSIFTWIRKEYKYLGWIKIKIVTMARISRVLKYNNNVGLSKCPPEYCENGFCGKNGYRQRERAFWEEMEMAGAVQHWGKHVEKKSICELCREYKSVFICASHSVCLMNLKGRILRISKWKYFLNDAKLGYELKRRKDLCDEWNIQNYI